MSLLEDDLEHALWNNQFYSSPAVLTELSSSNHLSNLRKQVVLPHLALAQLLSEHVRDKTPAAGTENPPKEGKLPQGGVASAGSAAGVQNRGLRTSLMKISPLMKALERALNLDSKPVVSPEAIAEEDEEHNGEPAESELEDVYKKNGGETARFDAPVNDPNSVARSLHLHSHDILFAHPGSRALAYSLLTFHTARSTDTVAQLKEEILGIGVTRHASVTTIEPPIYLQSDASTPKIFHSASLAASLQSTEDDDGEETFDENDDTAQEKTAQPAVLKSVDNPPIRLLLRPLDTPQVKSMVSSSSCPALSDKNAFAPSTPRDLRAGKREPSTKQASVAEEPKPAGSVKASPTKQRPVRSLLDSPFVASTKPPQTKGAKGAKGAKEAKEERGAHLGSTPAPTDSRHEKYPSLPGTPQSQRSSIKGSPLKTYSDAGVPRSPSFYNHKKFAASEPLQELSLASLPSSKTPNSKRFSFRGLFKIKSRNHSLSKLRDVEEDVTTASKPVKLSSKSFSTPNMSALTNDDAEKPKPLDDAKPEPRKRFFTRRGSTGIDLVKDTGIFGAARPPVPEKTKKAVKESQLPSTPRQQSTPIAVSSDAASEIPPHNGPVDPVDPKVETIREVEDSDYLPNITRDLPPPSPNLAILADQGYEETGEFSPLFPQKAFLNQASDSNSSPLFGSPFAVPYPPERPEITSHLQLNANFQPPPSPNRSTHSKISSEQLVGETLFPKSLDAHEVESIVSMERSRSMRSIKSSNKRSSFLNYNGSDENIILGKTLNSASLGSMKRSGSILKNSPSAQSLKPEKYVLMGSALDDGPREAPQTTSEIDSTALSAGDTDYVDFIEFSDYIDFDNLDFSASPLPDPYAESTQNYLAVSPSFGIYVEDETGTRSSVLDVVDSEPQPMNTGSNLIYEPSIEQGHGSVKHGENGKTGKEKQYIQHNDTHSAADSSAVDTSTAIDTTTSFDEPSNAKIVSNPSTDDVIKQEKKEKKEKQNRQSAAYVTSRVDPDASRVSSESAHANLSTYSLDPAPHESPMEKNLKFVIDENTTSRDTPSKSPRPVSMSFKGFHGSTLKDRVVSHSGSHQLIQFEEEFANGESSVGQGFGSSDEESDEESDDNGDGDGDNEDSDGDGDSFETHGNYNKFHTVTPDSYRQGGMLHKMNSFDRRQQHMKMVLDLQPPSSSLPFRHNRIPSISDQSSNSSPKLLTSLISRIRKSPMALPKMGPQKMALQKPGVKFSSRIILYDTYHHDEYDRHPELATCNQLTPALAQQIKEELNELKANMEVHQDSVCYTQFF